MLAWAGAAAAAPTSEFKIITISFNIVFQSHSILSWPAGNPDQQIVMIGEPIGWTPSGSGRLGGSEDALVARVCPFSSSFIFPEVFGFCGKGLFSFPYSIKSFWLSWQGSVIFL